ncbi:GNAT family N-acetyltransferase [Candidatus Bipolaricaulota bacterium]|nr:GNAT family N-acetyltransferase [Candidatus Bipolaricaulota bacterium]
MTFRTYQKDRDLEAVLRIYREVGWISEKAHEQAVQQLLESGRGLVAELQGSAECSVVADTGSIRYLETDLPLCVVAGVTTSRIARKQGLAGRLTAQLLAEEASEGQTVAMLGIFEQGYYNQLGFGNGSYENWCTLDPSMLQIPVKARTPIRLGVDDWQLMHDSRLTRLRMHGSCSINAPALTRADILWTEHGFGMGYMDEGGELSHHMWCSAKGEHGPYRVNWMAYRTKDQFLELMALLHSLGEQVRSIRLHEPPGIQLQDFIRQPFKSRQITERSPHENRMTAGAYWQVRILDLNQCLSATKLDCEPIRFNLTLTDPITSLVPEECSWKGIAGEYTVTLGSESFAEPGVNVELPTMRASVNAFSRLWLGIRSATSLSWSDDLEAPEALLQALDHALRLPMPMPDWDF